VTVAEQPPEGLVEFEAAVMADAAPATLIIDRALMRGLLTYLRRLEREAARELERAFW
jgi:hypothetical protein